MKRSHSTLLMTSTKSLLQMNGLGFCYFVHSWLLCLFMYSIQKTYNMRQIRKVI
ncbi:hypothetical protein P389DRAFT_14230 [Cystobasidium minutum MCA 4210]|uniref:uncharacterized protein n=1 Tax=Cystobasidium minutum MCA 4210 TaxID=1397322 RepID=UPI0034CE99C7|eukprot:jgi/Rhomi1/14230/CE14229_98